MIRQFSSLVKLRLLLNFISKTTSQMLLPFITIYLSNELGNQYAGIAVTIIGTTSIISTLYSGLKVDFSGRLPLMKIGECIKLLSYALMLLSSSIIMVFVAVLVINIAQGLINPATESMLLDSVRKDDKAKVLSINHWINNISGLIGINIGGLLFDEYFKYLNVLLLVTSVFVVVCVFLFITETKRVSVFRQKKTLFYEITTSYTSVLKNLRFFLYFCGMILIYTLNRQISNYIAVSFPESVTVNTLTFTKASILSTVVTINTIMVVVLLPLFIAKYKNKNIKLYLLLGLILMSLGYYVISYSQIIHTIFIFTIVLTFGEIISTPAIQGAFTNLVENDRKGVYVAVNSLAVNVSKILGGITLTLSAYFTREINSFAILFLGIGGMVLLIWSTSKSMS